MVEIVPHEYLNLGDVYVSPEEWNAYILTGIYGAIGVNIDKTLIIKGDIIKDSSEGDIITSDGALNITLGGSLDIPSGSYLDIGGTIDITGVLDEDDMVSDSAVKLATQQSIKKYVEDSTYWDRVGTTVSLKNSGDDVDLSGALSVDVSITIPNAAVLNQDYVVTNEDGITFMGKNSGGMIIQGQTSSIDSRLYLASKDMDRTDDVFYYARAFDNGVGGIEGLQMGYDASESRMSVRSYAEGLGIGRDMALATEGNETQLILKAGGQVHIRGNIELTGAGHIGVAADLLAFRIESTGDITLTKGITVGGTFTRKADSIMHTDGRIALGTGYTNSSTADASPDDVSDYGTVIVTPTDDSENVYSFTTGSNQIFEIINSGAVAALVIGVGIKGQVYIPPDTKAVAQYDSTLDLLYGTLSDNLELRFKGDDDSEKQIKLFSEVLDIAGTADEIETSVSGSSLIVGIVTNPTLSGDVTIDSLTALKPVWTNASKVLISKDIIACDVTRTFLVPAVQTVNTGTLTSGTVSDVQTWADGNEVLIREVTGVPGFDVEYRIDSVADFCEVEVAFYYVGSNTHDCVVEIYDDTNAVWRELVSQSGAGLSHNLRFVVVPADAADYINASDQVKIRFYHPVNGNASHYLHIDYVSIVGTST